MSFKLTVKSTDEAVTLKCLFARLVGHPFCRRKGFGPIVHMYMEDPDPSKPLTHYENLTFEPFKSLFRWGSS